jgi:hypothetical protein
MTNWSAVQATDGNPWYDNKIALLGAGKLANR